jgi:hypothetical protein
VPAATGALQLAIPGFKVPAILVPNISFPLFKPPTDLQLPVFKLPGALCLFSILCNCLCMPSWRYVQWSNQYYF